MMRLTERFLRAAPQTPGVGIRPLDLHRDAPDVLHLLALESWPFTRTDLEISHRQPGAASFVAHVDGALAGFFTTHTFGHVGYLDLFVVAEHHRGGPVARALYLAGLDALADHGVAGLVVHSTNDSARIIRLLGFSPGVDFTLLTRDGDPEAEVPAGDRPAYDALLAADAAVFGAPRPHWIGALLDVPGVRFVQEGEDVLCLRPRTEGAWCLDAVSTIDDDGLHRLVDRALATFATQPLQCFARTGSTLHQRLLSEGFTAPDFFVPIGPLVEWRRGDTGEVGLSERTQALSWL